MRAVPDYALFEELGRSDDAGASLWRDATVEAGEVAIGADWRVVMDAELAEGPMGVGAEDLRVLFRARAGFDLPVTPAAPEEKFVRLTTGWEAPPESYRINVGTSGVEVVGADAVGAMRGAFYLRWLMERRGAAILPMGDIERRTAIGTRIFRSPMAFYYREELDRADAAYPDAYLLKMARHGFNGVWLRGILRDLVRFEPFPEFGANADQLQAAARRLVRRCARFGIKVYSFFTEPLGFALDSPFWAAHPEVAGELCEPMGTRALCSSHPIVKAYLRQGSETLFREVPGLGGAILITASEHQTHCYSRVATRHGYAARCPACAKRAPGDVIAEIVGLIDQGARAASSEARTIAWNWTWTWYEEDPQRGIIGALPESVALLADFERGGRDEADGVSRAIDEYSLSYVGPSARFLGGATAAKEKGMDVFAKLQLGVTHELATVPSLPLCRNVGEKILRARENGVAGFMGCWNFGNFLSRNTEIAGLLCWDNPPAETLDGLVETLAARDFGSAAAPAFVRAWSVFQEAMRRYPFDNQFLYNSPANFGAAYPLFWKKTGHPMALNWMSPGEIDYNAYEECEGRPRFGDDLSFCARVGGPERAGARLRELLTLWEEGLRIMEAAVPTVPAAKRAAAEAEWRTASAVYSQYLSAARFIEFTDLRDRVETMVAPEEKTAARKRLVAIAEAELDNAEKLAGLAAADRRLGFHGEAFAYLYSPDKIRLRIEGLREDLREARRRFMLEPSPGRRF